MKTDLRSPFFVYGLAGKLLLVALVVPLVQSQWFVPFLQYAVHHATPDPWTGFLENGGDRLAFPYGPIMLLVHLPLAALGAGLDALFGESPAIAGLGFRLTLLGADLLALWAMLELAPTRRRLILIGFWLSPLSLYVTYWHGQTDIVPVTILLVAFVALKGLQPARAGALFGLAVATKLSMALTIPFVLIYLIRNRRLSPLVRPFITYGALVGLVILLPYAVLSHGFQRIVLGTPEAARLYALRLVMDGGVTLFLVPIAYILMLYACWRLRRSNFQLLLSISGVSFMAVVLGTLGAPGWYIWALPFVVLSLDEGDNGGILIGAAFQILVLVLLAATQTGARIPIFGINILSPPMLLPNAQFVSLWTTLVISTGLLLMIRMYREGVQGNDYYRLSRHPLAIGIAGDSGVGKDTLARSIEVLFGAHSVAFIYGDAYHKWDRGAPMWRTLTHLNPRANDLLSFSRDTLAVLSGHTALRRHYDHSTGRFSHLIATKPRDIVVVSGLHGLLPRNLVEVLDLKIYLDASEDLRSFWKLRRDAISRGQTRESIQRSIEARRIDSETYIRPQAQKADIVFMLSPVNPDHLQTQPLPGYVPLKLTVVLREGLYAEGLARALIGICAMRIDQTLVGDGQDIEMTIEGDVQAEDIQLAAHSLLAHLDELLDVRPKWAGDMLGIMQVILLLHIDQTLHKRTITWP